MRAVAGTLLLLSASLCWSGCDGSRATSTLVVTGSSTIAPIATRLAPLFEAHRPDLRVDVQSGGSSRGLHDLLQGVADVAMVSRDLRPDDGEGLVARVIARDAVAMIVHADNPIDGFTSDQVRGIWRGEIRDWSELGGAPGPITVVQKASGRGTFEVFMERFGLKEEEVRADVVVGENEHAIRTVAEDPRAVAYVSVGSVLQDRRQGVPVRPVKLDGVVPEVTTIASGRYSFVRSLHLVTRGEPSGAVRDWLDYFATEEAAAVIAEEGFVAPRP